MLSSVAYSLGFLNARFDRVICQEVICTRTIATSSLKNVDLGSGLDTFEPLGGGCRGWGGGGGGVPGVRTPTPPPPTHTHTHTPPEMTFAFLIQNWYSAIEIEVT